MATIKSYTDLSQSRKLADIINLNGIDYIEILAKTNDKICKDCAYFLDNGKCILDKCPCKNDDGILKRV